MVHDCDGHKAGVHHVATGGQNVHSNPPDRPIQNTVHTEFKGMLPENQTYAILKEYMLQAFELCLQMGNSGQPAGTAYYGVNNATDNSTIGTLTDFLNTM